VCLSVSKKSWIMYREWGLTRAYKAFRYESEARGPYELLLQLLSPCMHMFTKRKIAVRLCFVRRYFIRNLQCCNAVAISTMLYSYIWTPYSLGCKWRKSWWGAGGPDNSVTVSVSAFTWVIQHIHSSGFQTGLTEADRCSRLRNHFECIFIHDNTSRKIKG
jgi:hypothetical protein